MKKSTIKRILISISSAVVITTILSLGMITPLANSLSDLLYQRPQAISGEVMIVPIDQRSLKEIGPFQTWGRGVSADIINALNADKDALPAAIGFDTLFIGDTNQADDEALAKAAAQHNNVVVASMGVFGSDVVTNQDGSFYVDDYTVKAYDKPYKALEEAATVAHINAMNDKDGILRHAILSINPDDASSASSVNSFNYELYKMFAKANGIEQINTPPTNKRAQWYVPFSGKPSAYDCGVSVIDILNGDFSSDMFADKIVLIGPYAAGLRDTVTAAVDHATPMFGVEYQANAIDALISGNFKKEVPQLPQIIILFLLSAVALYFLQNRKVKSATVIWLSVSVLSIAISLLAYSGGYVINTLQIPLAMTIMYVVSVGINYVKAALERLRVTSTFQRYVAPEIVSELLKDGSTSLDLGGKLCDIAVLFVDIRGFTPMSELLNPEQVVEILNKYLTLTSTCIFKNTGTLDKFVGDCTMAFWGAPLPQEDCIYKAVKCALDMVEGSKALSEELMKQFGRTVSFGIGVHYGPAVVGNIGSPHRMDYTAIGDTVNTSARLEGNAPGGKVLVSRIVADALEGRVKFTSLGTTIKLKGKSDGFEILTADELC